MALNKNRLKAEIKAAFTAEQEETTDPLAALDRIAEKLANCIVDEIKELNINYTSGLSAPNGPVSGNINATIT